MEFNAIFKAFIRVTKENKSKKTAEQYKRYLLPLVKRVGVFDSSELSAKYVAGFLISYYQTPSTKRAFASAYRKLTQFAKEIYGIDLPHLPADYVPKQKAKEPKPLTKEEFKKLFDAIFSLPDIEQERQKNISFKLAFILTAFAGLRVSESLSVFPQDVQVRENVVFVKVRKGKGQKERIVPVADKKAKEYLLEHVDDLPATINRITFFKRLRKIGKQVGIYNLHPHRLRDTFLTFLADRGTPIEVLQDIAGHSSIEMTRKYVKVSLKRIEDAVSKVSFLSADG